MKRNELKGIIKQVIKECLEELTPKRSSQTNNPWALKHWVNESVLQEFEAEGDTEQPTSPDALDTKDAEMPPTPETSEDHPYSEEEEERLIKGLALIILKLLKMHKGEEEETTSDGDPDGEPDASSDMPASEDEPEAEKPEKLNERKMKSKNVLAKRFKKGLKEVLDCYNANQILEAGVAYKVRDGRSYAEDTGKVNRAREMQEDPNVNESNVGHVQARSAKTIKDVPQNPKNQNDPEIPVP